MSLKRKEKQSTITFRTYTLRSCPQIHGVANHTVAFVKKILNTELNNSTENPVSSSGTPNVTKLSEAAQTLDFLSIGVHKLASISERRIERLCNSLISQLSAFLVKDGGISSGFMVAYCTAAALVLCHPASVDSLSTSTDTKDHMSMGGWIARKALKMVEHVKQGRGTKTAS
ncbi:hypothetical protein MHYP_G00319770 [Metynnis hypsauchen]